jgi:hypothetical protein
VEGKSREFAGAALVLKGQGEPVHQEGDHTARQVSQVGQQSRKKHASHPPHRATYLAEILWDIG